MIPHCDKKKGQKVLAAQEGLGEVWLSSYHFAQNLKELEYAKIRAVCSAVSTPFKYSEQITHVQFHLEDNDQQKVSVKNVLEPAFDFIEGQREQGNVLVHCAAGVSRSCTLLISYMMKKYKYPYKKCLELVKAARPVANPNQGFVVQLKAYQKSLNII